MDALALLLLTYSIYFILTDDNANKDDKWHIEKKRLPKSEYKVGLPIRMRKDPKWKTWLKSLLK